VAPRRVRQVHELEKQVSVEGTSEDDPLDVLGLDRRHQLGEPIPPIITERAAHVPVADDAELRRVAECGARHRLVRHRPGADNESTNRSLADWPHPAHDTVDDHALDAQGDSENQQRDREAEHTQPRVALPEASPEDEGQTESRRAEELRGRSPIVARPVIPKDGQSDHDGEDELRVGELPVGNERPRNHRYPPTKPAVGADAPEEEAQQHQNGDVSGDENGQSHDRSPHVRTNGNRCAALQHEREWFATVVGERTRPAPVRPRRASPPRCVERLARFGVRRGTGSDGRRNSRRCSTDFLRGHVYYDLVVPRYQPAHRVGTGIGLSTGKVRESLLCPKGLQWVVAGRMLRSCFSLPGDEPCSRRLGWDA
jgi:hypothetical protein